MKLYYSHSDASVYPMGHTPQVLFDQLCISSIRVDSVDFYGMRLLAFIKNAITHPMVLFKHPGTRFTDVIEMRDRRGGSCSYATMYDFFQVIEGREKNPRNELVVITDIRASASTYGMDFIYLDPAVNGIMRRHFIDQVMETL